MGMNIKNSESHELALELARLRKVTVTRAVTDALRNDLDRARQRKSRAGLAADLMRIGERCAAHLTAGESSQDHGQVLYDDQGLPR
jgi:antitoxin VapB